MTALRKLTETYTYADYQTWGDEVRGELIDGVFYDMTPAPSFRHQDVAGGVIEQLRRQLRGKSCKPYISPVDVLLLNEGRDDGKARNVVQPDVLIVCDRSKVTDNVTNTDPTRHVCRSPKPDEEKRAVRSFPWL